MSPYYGLYRGTVVDNKDPLEMGRITLLCPAVIGVTPSTWAMPCVPLAGTAMGIFVVPQAGSGVWVQFEGGDPDYPVWMGGWWGASSELPSPAKSGVAGDPNIVLQTKNRHAVVLSDVPGKEGGIILQSSGGAKIIVNDTGIYAKNGKGATVELVGPSVSVNSGALKVT